MIKRAFNTGLNLKVADKINTGIYKYTLIQYIFRKDLHVFILYIIYNIIKIKKIVNIYTHAFVCI